MITTGAKRQTVPAHRILIAVLCARRLAVLSKSSKNRSTALELMAIILFQASTPRCKVGYRLAANH